MTIPLDTYDPNWAAKWNAYSRIITTEQSKPYGFRNDELISQLKLQLRAVFHAQFRTTGDYAEWMEDHLRQYAQAKGKPDFKIIASIGEELSRMTSNNRRSSPVSSTWWGILSTMAASVSFMGHDHRMAFQKTQGR